MTRSRDSLSLADREVVALVPQLRAKRLRRSASALELAKREPPPERLRLMSVDQRVEHGFDMFEKLGWSKREYHRESGHECWNHAWCLVTPNKGRVFTPFDLWVLEWALFVAGIGPIPSHIASVRSAS